MRLARRRTVWGLLALCLVATSANLLAAEPKEQLLWPEGAPGAVGDTPADQPQLTLYLVTAAEPAPVFVVCPGGGYGGLAMDHEGHQIAAWLNQQGISAAILRYRHAPRYRHPTPLGDLQRAIRTVRSSAETWRVRGDRLGVIGFSAGGHLTSTAATHFDAGMPGASDPIERQGCRPDAVVLGYPVISLVEPFTHAGSRRNLLGDEPDPALVELLSNERQVTAETPPAFLFSTGDDQVVPVENSLAFYAACRRAGVPAELHVFPHGPHGVGLAADRPELRVWPELVVGWLRTLSWLPAETP